MKSPMSKPGSFRRKLLISGGGFFFLVLIIASLFGNRGVLEIRRAQKKKDILIHKTRQMTERKFQLEREIKELETNPDAVEPKAREKLWLVKPDEIVVIK